MRYADEKRFRLMLSAETTEPTKAPRLGQYIDNTNMHAVHSVLFTTTRVFETKSFSSHTLALSLAVAFIHSFSLSLPECFGEQAAAAALGYTQVSWDNLSGKEQQPLSSIKSWVALVATEKRAAMLLGYNQRTWDNDSGSEPRPASAFKSWSELAACGDGEYNRFSSTIFPPILLTGLGGSFGFSVSICVNLSDKCTKTKLFGMLPIVLLHMCIT